jgi:glutathione S-transferase
LTFRIDRALEGTASILRLSGRLRAEELEALKDELAKSGWTAVLDLDELTLLDVDAVRLLESLERRGLELRNCAPYIRAWIARERAERDVGGSPR